MRYEKFPITLDLIGIQMTDAVVSKLNAIMAQGYTEKSICYCIWKSQEKLLSFKGDSRFWSVLNNEVRKHGFKKGVVK